MIKAIIYDMDDLMVNSDPLHIVAWEKILQNFNKKFTDIPEEIRSKFIGMRVIDISKSIIEILHLDTDLESFYNERINIFLDIVKNDLEEMPGLIYSLQLFKSHNFKIAIASSGAKQYIDLVLDKFDIRKYFDVIISGDCVSIGKPHPETYLVASEKLGLNPRECVVLEDATNGIEAAIQAGCKCIAIINTNTVPQNYSKANLVLNSLNDITLENIDSLNI
jgi:HAD superfamily hydrolase (TIGR01509 family)